MLIFRKGNAWIPERFWDYAIGEERHIKEYLKLGYRVSQKDTLIYSNMDEEQKKKVVFKYVNLKKSTN